MLQFLLGLVAWVAAHQSLFAFSSTIGNLLSAAAVILGMWGITSQATDPSPLAVLFDKLPANGYKTLIGTALAVLAYLLSPDVYATLPAGLAHVLEQVGIILGGFGLFHKMAKTATAPSIRSVPPGPSR